MKKVIKVIFPLLIISIVGVVYYNLTEPTKLNYFVASKIYKAPANNSFTDDNFYKCVVDAYNKENKTSVAYTDNLTDEQLKSIYSLDCNGENKDNADKIKSVVGLEKLSSLTTLVLSNNQLIEVDVTNNILLEYLYLSNNQFEIIDVTNNKNLKILILDNNYLTGVEVSNNLNLTRLDLYNNQLGTIDISNNKSLVTLFAFNNKLTSIDISKNINLEKLELDNNELTTLDVSNNINLEQLTISDNKLNKIDVSNNIDLIDLDISNNKFTNLDISKNVNLTYLYISSNEIKNIDLSNNIDLVELYAQQNKIKEIDINGNIKLKALSLSGNELHKIDISKNILLEKLFLSNYETVDGNPMIGNQITELDLSNNVNLNTLALNHNPLKKLDLSQNTKLTSFTFISGFQKEVGIYKGEFLSVPKFNQENLTLFDGKISTLFAIHGPNRDVPMDIKIQDNNQIEMKETGFFQYKAKYKHNINTMTNDFHNQTYNVCVIEATSNKYIIDAKKNYIYTGINITPETILSNINLNYGKASIEDDKLLIKYGDEIVKSFDIKHINFVELNLKDKRIVILEEIAYEDFISNITTNGVTYKIFNGEEEVTTGNITPGMKLEVYVGEELVDTYQITDEYLEISDNLNVNETTGMIEDLTVGQTVENIKENIDTTGTVKVVDQENNEVTNTVGTGYKVVIELSKETIEYTLVVSGDITGDGEIKMSDVMKAATQMIEENTIVGDCYLKAADVTGDGKIKMSDVMKLANLVLEGGNN